MKKTLNVILALVLACAMALAVFAAEGNVTGGDSTASSDKTVTATYDALENKDGGKVYYVNITWGSQSGDLTYSAGETVYTWDGASMQYKAGTAGDGAGWDGSATVAVTVANRSNAGITATGSSSNSYNLEISATSALSLGSAAVKDNQALEITSTETGTEQTGTITFTIDANDSTTAWDGSATVGTLTVTIAPQA